MITTNRRYARLVHELFAQAPALRPRVLSLSRSEADRWGSPRRVVTATLGTDLVGVIWFENQVWHTGRVNLEDGVATLSPTRVHAATVDPVNALFRLASGESSVSARDSTAESAVAAFPTTRRRPAGLAGAFAA